MNKAYSLTTTDHILYAHDDMYFCKNWDIFLTDEINKQNDNQYYLSGTNVSTRHGLINYDCGSTYLDFDEKKFHNFCLQDQTPDLQSSHWAPHLIHKELWDKIGGFSEEFNPGDGSDPDFCMKLWKQNVRIFKGVSKFKVYHFNSLTTRNDKIVLNNGTRAFLSKYGFNPKFFRKYYLRGNNSFIPFKGRLNNPKKNFSMLLDLSINKIKYTINKFRA
jgi:GT2 family glycosyltransferase